MVNHDTVRDDNSDPADQDRPAPAADLDRPVEQPTPLSWTDPASGVARTDWEQEFVAFFRSSYRTLLVQAQYAGADREERASLEGSPGGVGPEEGVPTQTSQAGLSDGFSGSHGSP